jgi:hypothetical protein
MADETVLTEDEIEAIQRDSILEQPDRTSSDAYPRLANMSAGMMYKAVIRAQVPEPAEYVTIKISTFGRDALAVHIAQWNLLWEAAQFRRRFFDEDDLPKELAAVADRGDLNVVFVPRTPTRYHEYAPLYHLLPRGTAERHGLPLLRSVAVPRRAHAGRRPPTRRLRSQAFPRVGRCDLAAPRARITVEQFLRYRADPVARSQPRLPAPARH